MHLSYAHGVASRPLLGQTLGQALDTAASRFGARDALISLHQNLRYSYAELLHEVNRAAKGLIALGVFIVVVMLWRYVSLASICAAIAAALVSVAMFGWSAYAWAVLAVVALVIWRHRANVQRLLAGTESKVASTRSAMPPSDPAA